MYAFPSGFSLLFLLPRSLPKINYLHANLGLRLCFLEEPRLRYQPRRVTKSVPKLRAKGSPRVTAEQEAGEYTAQTGEWRPREGRVLEIS